MSTSPEQEQPERQEAGRYDRLCDLASLVLALLALVWISYQGWRLVLQGPPRGGIDLGLRWLEVKGWLAGDPIYRTIHDAVYPPASYAMLIPLLGFIKFTTARWIWAGIQVVVLWLLGRMLVCASGARTRSERRMIALLPLGTYPVGACLGNGQLGIVVLTCLVAVIGLLQKERSLGRDLALAGLLTLSLVKPTVSAPFFWLVLWLGGLRPASISVLAYVGLALLASTTQPRDVIKLHKQWHHRGVVGAQYGSSRGEGAIQLAREAEEVKDWEVRKDKPRSKREFVIRSVNAHSVLSSLGFARFSTRATFGLLALAGLLVGLMRRGPPWALAGVTAIIARLYAYHAWYDDVLLLVPIVALARIVTGSDKESPGRERLAGLLLVANLLAMLAPGGVYSLPRVPANVYVIAHTLVILVTLGLLVASARGRRESQTSGTDSGL